MSPLNRSAIILSRTGGATQSRHRPISEAGKYPAPRAPSASQSSCARQSLMRHSRFTTTAEVYEQDLPESQLRAVEKLSALVQ